ncbi:MAG: hypothetical protein PHT40_04235 [Patescibacteria group bacterium]|nr:hypothetical protein [Patescibacteria group bacterium]
MKFLDSLRAFIICITIFCWVVDIFSTPNLSGENSYAIVFFGMVTWVVCTGIKESIKLQKDYPNG